MALEAGSGVERVEQALIALDALGSADAITAHLAALGHTGLAEHLAAVTDQTVIIGGWRWFTRDRFGYLSQSLHDAAQAQRAALAEVRP